MARQNTSPVQYSKSVRSDNSVLMTSGKAGIVMPLGYIPILPGDSMSGRMSIDMTLAEMPKPLLNAVFANVQAWFVPKPAHPQFSGMDEYIASFQETKVFNSIPGIGDRTPPAYFRGASALSAVWASSGWWKRLGLPAMTGKFINVDFYDAVTAVYNFRLQAHSSKLALKPYYGDPAADGNLDYRAFWPTGRLSRVVADYERALLLGQLDMDIAAGNIPIQNLLYNGGTQTGQPAGSYYDAGLGGPAVIPSNGVPNLRGIWFDPDSPSTDESRVSAKFGGEVVITSLAGIDKARTTQAFAKLMSSYRGNSTDNFGNEQTLIAHLMQGLSVPPDLLKRPILLDSKRIPFGFAERFASDGASLDQSVTTARASANLVLNVPQTDVGGMVIVTGEVLPERIDERMQDPFWELASPSELPNALRDIQRLEPVDIVKNKRVDMAHTTPDGLYGYEPMNDVWNRAYTRMGGRYYQPDPTTPVNDARMGVWLANLVNPVFNSDHYLAPKPFPHTVFSDTTKDAVDIVVRHACKIVGLTQFGDPMVEDNGDWADVEGEQL